ncbi:hypothetical protein DMN91_012385 [Ooceraea biroi]|uniref:Uncharacterized protein n=1 Tax=Ooceraea biroi TaxID=2015173 RepID=A0A3L8D5F6_OOCBI|nr:uncharacterized protein LOC105286342 [Ooceraea biroi]RLU15391.1 hypothetical protein DMN91_012385 [Ooceraea biroi]
MRRKFQLQFESPTGPLASQFLIICKWCVGAMRNLQNRIRLMTAGYSVNWTPLKETEQKNLQKGSCDLQGPIALSRVLLHGMGQWKIYFSGVQLTECLSLV